MMWKPNGVSTRPLIWPGASAHAGAVERRHELSARARRQVAAVGLAAGILGELERELVEAAPFRTCASVGLGLLLHRRLLRRRRPWAARRTECAGAPGCRAPCRGCPPPSRVTEPRCAISVSCQCGALQLGDLRPHRLGDAGRVCRQLVLRHRLPEQRVVDPHVGDVVGGLAVDLDPLPARAQDLREPLRRELLAGGLRRHVGVRREEVAEVAAADEAEREARREDHVASHDISRRGYFTAALSARTSAGTIGSPPSRSSRSESGTVRRTSAASCTSSSAEVSPASRGFVPARIREPCLVASDQHVLEAEHGAQDAKPRHVEQCLGLYREAARSVRAVHPAAHQCRQTSRPAPVGGRGPAWRRRRPRTYPADGPDGRAPRPAAPAAPSRPGPGATAPSPPASACRGRTPRRGRGPTARRRAGCRRRGARGP